MNKPTGVKRPATRRVVDTSVKTPRVSAEEVAKALGADPEGQRVHKNYLYPERTTRSMTEWEFDLVSDENSLYALSTNMEGEMVLFYNQTRLGVVNVEDRRVFWQIGLLLEQLYRERKGLDKHQGF